jgi:hypothetical protein
VFCVGCPRNKQKKFSVRTETNRNSACFGSFSVCFAKPINYFFGLFRFVSVFRIHIETTETNRTVSKQTEKNIKNCGKRSQRIGTQNCFLNMTIMGIKNPFESVNFNLKQFISTTKNANLRDPASCTKLKIVFFSKIYSIQLL